MLLVVTAPSLGLRVLILLFSICLSQTLSDQSDLSALSHLILTPPCLQCVCVWVSTSIMSWRPIIKVKRCCSVVQCRDLLSQVSISFFFLNLSKQQTSEFSGLFNFTAVFKLRQRSATVSTKSVIFISFFLPANKIHSCKNNVTV